MSFDFIKMSHLQHITYFWINFGVLLRMNIQKVTVVILIGFLLSGVLSAQEQSKNLTRILFIYDASNSMNGVWEGTSKHKLASRLLQETLDSLDGTKNLELALRVYGHQHLYTRGQECNDTKLEVPFGKDNGEEINKALSQVKPRGTTPIALTLEKAAGDFSTCTSCRNIIILITDGIEECDGDPCAAARLLKENNIRLKPFIIGIGLDESFKKSFDCVGNFYDVSHRNDFEQVLNVVIRQALNPTTVQLNLLDENQNPTETNTPFSLFNQKTGELDYHYIHTLNAYGAPDTFFVDPNSEYDLVVHSLLSR
jgi:Ca-activated chloride channel family protein